MTTNQPRVSVIVPVYNTEAYLAECLDSLLAQDLKDIEIICVDDGSTDRSGQILCEYADRDSRVVVHVQSNQGLSEARNAGVKRASGEYLHFLDSDDYLDPGSLSRLHEAARADDLDVVYFDAQPFFEAGMEIEEHDHWKGYYQRKADYPDVVSGRQLFQEMVMHGDYRPSACLQLIRREYYLNQGCAFIGGILHEDGPFTFQCMMGAARVRHLPQAFYWRRIRIGSLMIASKGLANFKGYLAGYLVILRSGFSDASEGGFSKAVARLCGVAFHQMVKVFRQMDSECRAMVFGLDSSPDAQLTCHLVGAHVAYERRLGRRLHFLQRLSPLYDGSQDAFAFRFAREAQRLADRWSSKKQICHPPATGGGEDAFRDMLMVCGHAFRSVCMEDGAEVPQTASMQGCVDRYVTLLGHYSNLSRLQRVSLKDMVLPFEAHLMGYQLGLLHKTLIAVQDLEPSVQKGRAVRNTRYYRWVRVLERFLP